MRLIKPLIFSGLFLLSPMALAKVAVTVDQQTLMFDSAVRLDAVLAVTAKERSVFWPAAALYLANDADVAQLHSTVLGLLDKLGQEAAPEQQVLLRQLTAEVNSWQLAKRLPLKIDLDLARLSLAANPLLQEEQYLLRLPTRPKHIYVFGAITNAGRVLPHQAVTSVQNYLRLVTRQSADHNQLTVIQADGRVIPVALYGSERSYQEVQPGGVLFVPFKSSLFDKEFTELNRLLVELVAYRVLP